MPGTTWRIDPHDVDILRSLAARRLDIVHHPLNVERRQRWYDHDAGRPGRPMVLAENGVAFEQLPESRLECREEWARGVESGFRFEAWQFDVIRDDHVVEPWLNCGWRVGASGYGVEIPTEWAERVSGNVASRHWDHPIKDLDADFDRLKPRTFTVDRQGSLDWADHLASLFDGLLPVRMRGAFWWTTGMTWPAMELLGLEPMMLAMVDNPAGMHRLMGFLRDDHLAFIDWLEREGLFTLNNENDYIGSGSMGYTHALPGADLAEGAPVRSRDLWVLSESQETVSVGPSMFEEFVLEYQLPVIARFGRCYYGCCEPVHTRWKALSRIPNLNRVSVSPWCDQERMAEHCGRGIAFSRKPNPALVSTDQFDEAAIREDIRTTLRAARKCNVELVMKDVHTLAGEHDRLARWVALANGVIDADW